MTIQPTNVYPPNQPPGGNNTYNTYNTTVIPPNNPGVGAPPFYYRMNPVYQAYKRTPPQSTRVQSESHVPAMLTARPLIFYSWMAAMILVSFDEWHNYHILPRPARLFWTTVTYGLLTIASIPDVMVPLANALAMGYTIVLAYQYYNGQGQFEKPSTNKAAANG